jgi:hypothetical protein
LQATTLPIGTNPANRVAAINMQTLRLRVVIPEWPISLTLGLGAADTDILGEMLAEPP